MTRAALAAVACVVAACGSDSSGIDSSAADAGFTVIDSAGVEIVMNGARGALGELTLREDLRLGVLEGDGPEQFSEVYAVATGEDGRIAVGDNASGTVRVFDHDGTFLIAVGGRGDGWGEVSMVNEVVTAGDTIVAIDWQRGGKAVFHALDGRLVRSTTLRTDDGVRFSPAAHTRRGRPATRSSQGARPTQPGDSATSYQELWFTDPDRPEFEGDPAYRIPVYTLYATSGEGEFDVDWGLFRGAGPLASGFDDRGRMYTGHASGYRVDVLAPDRLVRSVRRAWEPRVIVPDDVAAVRAAAIEAVDTMGRIPERARAGQREQIAQRIDRQAALPIPEAMGAVAGLLVSPDGSFWVQVADLDALVAREIERMFGGFGGAPPRETRWDLYDPEGRLLGGVTLPARFRPEAVVGREVVGVWYDEFDVEYVVRYVADPAGSE